MLGFLKIQPLDLNDASSYGVVELINSIVCFFKGITVFDSILPKDIDSGNFQNNNNKKNIKHENKKELFPTSINYDSTILEKTSAIPCSTLQQPIFKMEHSENGFITWNFGETDNNTNTNNNNNNHNNIITSFKYSSDIPDLPNPEFFDIELNNKTMTDESELSISPSTSNSSTFESSIEKDHSDNKKSSYPCEYCNAEFKIRGYLTRHIKKHALNKAYECPFFDEHSESKCHPNGGFSRRDTYKTHLKARHFKYPKGTRSFNRSSTPGHCASCMKPFANNEEWVEKHIENGECTGLPKDYQVRGKNTRRKHYEFPTSRNSNGINSPVSLSSNSPEHHSHQHNSITSVPSSQQLESQSQQQTMLPSPLPQSQLQGQIPMSSYQSPLSVESSQLFTSEKIIFQGFDYEDNDEFSLDVEQCLSYRPLSR